MAARWKFTGDGIMAVFGAPVALEDHAVRACLAALGVQEEAKRLAVEVAERDGVDLRLRVGLNSGQVIAGEIGSGPFGYTAVGEQVGMAQRMESVAPPGGVHAECVEMKATAPAPPARSADSTPGRSAAPNEEWRQAPRGTKTVTIPGSDGRFVLQLNADGTEDQMGVLMDATSVIDQQTTITPKS